MVSQGVPMILYGDEIGRTQNGNNNSYCQDNELSWFDWSKVEENGELARFFKMIIALRHAHPVLRSSMHYRNRDYTGSGYADISWHGQKAWNADFSRRAGRLPFCSAGNMPSRGSVTDNDIYVAMNMHWEMHGFELPGLPEGKEWYVFSNTDVSPPFDICLPGDEPKLENQREILVGPRSIIILISK